MASETAPTGDMEFTHLPMNEDILSISGGFRITEEKRMLVDNNEIFYLIGIAHMDNACCGSWGCSFAVVKGIVKEWKFRKDQDGNDVTRLMPVADQKEKEHIMNRIMSEEMVQQVVFT